MQSKGAHDCNGRLTRLGNCPRSQQRVGLLIEGFRGPCYEFFPEDDILGVADAIQKARHFAV